MRHLISLLTGTLIGLIAWPHAIWLAPAVFLVLPLFRTAAAPFLALLGYHLATTYGLIHGTAVFFPHAGLPLGIAFWVFSSLAFALPYWLYRAPCHIGFDIAIPINAGLYRSSGILLRTPRPEKRYISS